jgi:NADPH-dependent 7-cyano-7-deazaguanine reductase QueF-like protein
MESQMSCKDYLGSSNSTLMMSNQSLKQELLAQALSILLNSTIQVNYTDLAELDFPEQVFGSDP